jgi:phosphomannomutase
VLDLIADMEEMDEVTELRMTIKDGSLDTMRAIFDFCCLKIEEALADKANPEWELDADNLEGIRVRTGQGQFFMLRKSLHDPIISLQIEAVSQDDARRLMVEPIMRLFESEQRIPSAFDLTVLRNY